MPAELAMAEQPAWEQVAEAMTYVEFMLRNLRKKREKGRTKRPK